MPVGDPVARYRIAVDRLNALIQPVDAPREMGLAAVRQRAERRLARLRRFLAYLGDPQDAFPVVHVAGTSGKGSTSAAVAAILGAGGYRVGLHTSPYLQVATEKLQLDGELIGGEAFAGLVDDLLDAAARWANLQGEAGFPSYGELWTALTTSWFARERVDVAVIEVGAGGRFDPTNVVRPAVAVVTTIGLDHTATLGGTIGEIAWHKAGIIKGGAAVVTGVTDPAALGPIVAEAATTGAPLFEVAPGRTFEVVETARGGTRWRELSGRNGDGLTYETRLPGGVHALNAALAVATVRQLAGRGFPVVEDAVRDGLRRTRLPGRAEVMLEGGQRCVVLDGAHNPQKLAALVADLNAILGQGAAARPVVVLGALDGKDLGAMVELVAPRAAALVMTGPRVLGKRGADPADLAAAARFAGFSGQLLVAPDPDRALDVALEAAVGLEAPVLVTGSLYLVGQVRDRWYPDEQVVRQRTPWPAAGAAGATPMAGSPPENTIAR